MQSNKWGLSIDLIPAELWMTRISRQCMSSHAVEQSSINGLVFSCSFGLEPLEPWLLPSFNTWIFPANVDRPGTLMNPTTDPIWCSLPPTTCAKFGCFFNFHFFPFPDAKGCLPFEQKKRRGFRWFPRVPYPKKTNSSSRFLRSPWHALSAKARSSTLLAAIKLRACSWGQLISFGITKISVKGPQPETHKRSTWRMSENTTCSGERHVF